MSQEELTRRGTSVLHEPEAITRETTNHEVSRTLGTVAAILLVDGNDAVPGDHDIGIVNSTGLVGTSFHAFKVTKAHGTSTDNATSVLIASLNRRRITSGMEVGIGAGGKELLKELGASETVEESRHGEMNREV
jgi:hypothetical protein